MIPILIILNLFFVTLQSQLVVDITVGRKPCEKRPETECQGDYSGCFIPALNTQGFCTRTCNNYIQCHTFFDGIDGPGGSVCDGHVVGEGIIQGGKCIPRCSIDSHCHPDEYCGKCEMCDSQPKTCLKRERTLPVVTVPPFVPPNRPSNLPYPVGCYSDEDCAFDEKCSERYGHCKEKRPNKKPVYCGPTNGLCKEENEVCAYTKGNWICVSISDEYKTRNCMPPAPYGMKCFTNEDCLYDKATQIWYCKEKVNRGGAFWNMFSKSK